MTAGVSDPPAAQASAAPIPHARASSAWLMVGIAALVLAGPIIFVAQNSGSSRVSFLFFHERRSVTIALLVVAAAGWVLALGLGAVRVLYVRRSARLSRRQDHATALDGGRAADPGHGAARITGA